MANENILYQLIFHEEILISKYKELVSEHSLYSIQTEPFPTDCEWPEDIKKGMVERARLNKEEWSKTGSGIPALFFSSGEFQMCKNLA